MYSKFIDGKKSLKDFNSHSYISLKNKYFFHSVGKAANSTVKYFLYQEELRGTGIKFTTVHDRLASPLVSPYQLSEDLLDEVLLSDNYFRFTFVRNPFSRILSCYLDRIKEKKSAPYKELVRYSGVDESHDFSFEEFVNIICSQDDFQQNNHWRLQYADTMCDIINYNFIGKQESFAVDMEFVWKSIFLKSSSKEVNSENKSPSKTNSLDRLNLFYTKDLEDKIRKRFEKDFDFFSYPNFI